MEHDKPEHPVTAPAAETASEDPWTSGEEQRQPSDQSQGHQQLLEKVLLESVTEQRRARRWGIVFKSLTFIYLFALLFAFLAGDWESGSGISGGRHTALVDVKGLIAAGEEANADNIVAGLRAAFKNQDTAAVILRINSPGGSPVQAGYVYDEIIRLRAKHEDTPLYAVVMDVCASGRYYMAAAADKIYANQASLVGSIGVRMDSFGFVGAMEKLGIERRLLTAGESKGLLDPFQPLKEEEVAHARAMLEDIHRQFITNVKEGRGDRLDASQDLFSGLIWTGEQSVKLGLVDDLASASQVAREVVKVKKIRNFTVEEDLLQRVVEGFGMVLAKGVGLVVDGHVELR